MSALTVRYNPRHPDRARYFMQRDGAVLAMVLRIFLRVLRKTCRLTVPVLPVAFIHRFGSSLNEHVHLHVGVVDGILEAVAGDSVIRAERHSSGRAVQQWLLSAWRCASGRCSPSGCPARPNLLSARRTTCGRC